MVLSNSRGANFDQVCNTGKTGAAIFNAKEAATIFEGFDEPDAELLIHGIIDGYVELPDRIILYDFKTDAVFGSEAQIEKRMRDRYYGQLKLYCQALEQALQKPVTETYLVLLAAKKNNRMVGPRTGFLTIRKRCAIMMQRGDRK